MPVSNKIGGNTFAAKLLSGIDSVVGGGRGMRQANASNSGKHMLCNVALWGCIYLTPFLARLENVAALPWCTKRCSRR